MPANAAINHELVRAALEELLGWQGISRSPQLGELLRYVVEKALAGDGASIKAYAIAVDVFGRPQSFDPQSDPIVRVQARRLRAAIDEFYRSGEARAAIEIRLPLGRYIPEFTSVSLKAPVQSRSEAEKPVDASEPQTKRLPGPGALVIIGLFTSLVGVGLTVALLRWILPPNAGPQRVETLPEVPTVSIGAFDNLTGQPNLDASVAGISAQLAASLAKFEFIQVAKAAGSSVLQGSLLEEGGHLVLKASLVDSDARGTRWTARVEAPADLSSTDALAQATRTIAAQLGNSSGPLFVPAREWLAKQTSPPSKNTLFICGLELMNWRNSLSDFDALGALDCFNSVLANEPQNAIALAAAANLEGWEIKRTAGQGEDMSAKLSQVRQDVDRAIGLAPDRSFVEEMRALVLVRQSPTEAFASIDNATILNPANMDALAIKGIMLWSNGNWDIGAAAGERALATIANPPPWYYMTRAFNALRERRYFDAIDAAQALSVGDFEFGPAIVLAAAPFAARNDLIDRYRSILLSARQFQEVGIMPRLAGLVAQPALLDRIRDGLVLAGIPPSALDGPFKPDGSPR